MRSRVCDLVGFGPFADAHLPPLKGWTLPCGYSEGFTQFSANRKTRYGYLVLNNMVPHRSIATNIALLDCARQVLIEVLNFKGCLPSGEFGMIPRGIYWLLQ